MNENSEAFIYEWNEPIKKQKITPMMILQAVILSTAISVIPVAMQFFSGGQDRHPAEIISWAVLMAIMAPVIIMASVRDSGGVLPSALLIDRDGIVRITRYVTSDSGRQYFAVWDSLEWRQVRIRERECILQVDASWKVSAHKVKTGIFHKKTVPGSFVDSDIRDYPQTFKLPAEDFGRVMGYLKNCSIPVREMTVSEYEKAVPFLLKHHTV